MKPPGAAIIVWILTLSVGCGRSTNACKVVRLEIAGQARVLDSYGGRFSYFSSHCVESTPKEVAVDGEPYSVHIYFMTSEDPHIFVGTVPHDPGRFDFKGSGLSRMTPQSAFRNRLTYATSLSHLSDGLFKFQILDRLTEKTVSYSYKASAISCTCVTYDGP